MKLSRRGRLPRNPKRTVIVGLAWEGFAGIVALDQAIFVNNPVAAITLVQFTVGLSSKIGGEGGANGKRNTGGMVCESCVFVYLFWRRG